MHLSYVYRVKYLFYAIRIKVSDLLIVSPEINNDLLLPSIKRRLYRLKYTSGKHSDLSTFSHTDNYIFE